MMVIGRNEICHCGSRKKYKKCCLNTDVDKRKEGTKTINLSDTPAVAHSSHDITLGIKELTLDIIEQTNILLSRDPIQGPSIMIKSFDLIQLSKNKNIIELYVKMVKEVLVAKKTPFNDIDLENIKNRAYTLPGLTENEKLILKTVGEFNTDELGKLAYELPVNYRAMEILNEFCYNVIKDGVSDTRNISAVTFYLEKDKKNRWELVDWEFTYSIGKNEVLLVNWETRDVINNKYHRFFNSMNGLEEESKRDIEKTLYPHRKDPGKSHDKLSFKERIMNLSGIFERELPILIELNEAKKVPDLTWKDMNTYIKENPLPFIVDIPDFYEVMEQIGEIRNLAANGNEVSNEDYLKIKEFAFDRRAFIYISLSKTSYKAFYRG